MLVTSFTGFSYGKTAGFAHLHRKKRPKTVFARKRR
ncbi:hypothetical protein PFWH6_5451 [Pseudomonas fluorescens WH6]|nr:hypothetical protein PFWH6_5451 [Pseudomonas fluorescens WH6]